MKGRGAGQKNSFLMEENTSALFKKKTSPKVNMNVESKSKLDHFSNEFNNKFNELYSSQNDE
jgi:hypothetical protein